MSAAHLQGHDHEGQSQDEYVLDTPVLRSFVAEVRAAISGSTSPAEAVESLRPPFARLLNDREWLPYQYQAPAPGGGMGGGIGQWLLFRSGERDLSLFSSVVPPGASTPVHDHLAWGLVGLYRGEQGETVFSRPDESAPVSDTEDLTVAVRRTIRRGDFYPLLPPTEDIHTVRTISREPSVSLHLLAGDTGCIWRHAYDPETSKVRPFKSGYTNRSCGE